MQQHIHISQQIPGYLPESEINTTYTAIDTIYEIMNEIDHYVQDWNESAWEENPNNPDDSVSAQWADSLDNRRTFAKNMINVHDSGPESLLNWTIVEFDNMKLTDNIKMSVWRCLETNCEDELGMEVNDG